MDLTIHASFLPHNDPDACLTFYRDTLGFEARNDVVYNGMHWLTVGPVDPTSSMAGSVDQHETRSAHPSRCTRRPPPPVSPTTSAAPSSR